MKRDEYLFRLKNCLQALPIEEQTEALDFYYNYFEDANDDKKVMKELGTPEKLADEIKAKFSCVPATQTSVQKVEDQEEEQSSNQNSDAQKYSPLVFEFPNAQVNNLDFALGIAEIVMIAGDTFKVETRGIDSAIFRCELSEKGSLIIQNMFKLPKVDYFGPQKNKNNPPRILITIPNNYCFKVVRLSVGAGCFKSKGVSFATESASFEVNAGDLILESVTSGTMNFHCGMGRLIFNGTPTDVCKVDCGMGLIELNVKGSSNDYSIESNVGAGAVKFNNTEKGGIGNLNSDVKKQNHFMVNCGFGKVNINF